MKDCNHFWVKGTDMTPEENRHVCLNCGEQRLLECNKVLVFNYDEGWHENIVQSK